MSYRDFGYLELEPMLISHPWGHVYMLGEILLDVIFCGFSETLLFLLG